MLIQHVFSTNAQKILKLMLAHPRASFYERSIASKAGISTGSANSVLRELCKDGILKRKNEGRMAYYALDLSNIFVKELKTFGNLLLLEPLVQQLKRDAYKIVLFGSWATGTDDETSDIDLFIKVKNEQNARAIVDKFSKTLNRKIQAIMKTPSDLMESDDRDKELMKQVERGKILWEKEINDADI